MPYSLKRPLVDNPKVKEWYSKTHDNGYVEIIKFNTIEEANNQARQWGGSPEVVEVPNEVGSE